MGYDKVDTRVSSVKLNQTFNVKQDTNIQKKYIQLEEKIDASQNVIITNKTLSRDYDISIITNILQIGKYYVEYKTSRIYFSDADVAINDSISVEYYGLGSKILASDFNDLKNTVITNGENIIADKLKILDTWEHSIFNVGLDEFIADSLMDDSDINKSKSSNNIFNAYKLQNGTIEWNLTTTEKVFKKVYIKSDYNVNTGNVKFYVMVKNGVDYVNIECALNTLIDISSQNTGSEIALRIIISGDSTVNCIGVGWQY